MRATNISEIIKHNKSRLLNISINRENRSIILQGILAFLFIALALYFVKHQRTELIEVKNTLLNASLSFVLLGIALAVFFIFIQGMMYYASFRSVGERITVSSAMVLFIKRNFISIFLPAGGISSLAFFTKNIEQQKVSKSKIHVASSIYAFVGIISVVIVAIPALAYALTKDNLSSKEIYVFIGLVAMLAITFHVVQSILAKGWVYKLAVKISPDFEAQLAELRAINFNKKQFVLTILFSVLIEFIGVAHLLIAMRALGYPLSLEGAALGYIVSVMFLIVSPFLRGLGAIELSLSFILTRFGFSTLEAISITFLYRFFEFWFLLIIGAFSFVFVKNNIILRIAPVILTFGLGLVNIFSVLTPAIQYRLKLLHHLLPLYAIDLSN
ncbi:MAG TPA: lysylphosphatidylglycerol synthase domain-containing protein, partial [Sunxiuqinia sp.]|nr:lysylphosphatidylglycerol synthase domain-containing protein [Sunxiuqinia sp.]